MSGGVDSSVAAALLVARGYDVVGATMKLFSHGDELPDRPCCSLDSVNDARRVCERLGVPHYVLNLQDRFGRDVIDDFVSEYVAGRTPIPCVRCNTFTKFHDLLHTADSIDARWIATGHYARVQDGLMLRGRDDNKDQSYFLWGIQRAVLSRMLLPVGEMTKDETRRVAADLQLTMVAQKPESQEICFVPDGDYARVIATHAGDDSPALARGRIVDSAGRTLGEHDGYARFTVGQRRGLPGGFREPLYVTEIRPAERVVVVGPREKLLACGVVVRDVNWLVQPPPKEGAAIHVRVRHRAPLAPAHVESVEGGSARITFARPVAAVTPGQSVVMYEGEIVLGGGIVERAVAVEGSGEVTGGRSIELPVLATP